MEARGLEKSFRTDDLERPVLRGLSLEVERGEWVAAMGPSGCGKSTMLHLLGGLDLPDAGSVRLGDDEITALSGPDRARLRRRRVGYLFQQSSHDSVPEIPVTPVSAIFPEGELGLRLGVACSPEHNDVDEIPDPMPDAERTASAARVAGYRYPTPTGEPCPRTIRVDGTIEFGGNCQSCGMCLLYGELVERAARPLE